MFMTLLSLLQTNEVLFEAPIVLKRIKETQWKLLKPLAFISVLDFILT